MLVAYDHVIKVYSGSIQRPAETYERSMDWLYDQNIDFEIETVRIFTYAEFIQYRMVVKVQNPSIYYLGGDPDTVCYGYTQFRFDNLSDAVMYKLRWC